MLKLHSNNLLELPSIAEKLLSELGEKKIICIYGQMGVGKTTLIKEICNLLGVSETVSSPTFSLVNEYTTIKGENIFHFDFYRIKNLEEVYDIGYQEYFYSGNLCLIEWPELIEQLIPLNAMRIFISINQGQRTYEIK
ncbi:MAG TPA: tRNA (adenosine(37)-N6)-threonylcarbamoyltransferase complex ATPase subunit type 1 TsaE [Bacteroidia bacterium]|nr:tRNA (adenosine(37)-N6)-threonylcarbamoyltransferase complex ATPase subunit type 1 TsaE [Bacteroidia bacterium]HNU33079.1 tRNA (adenosine(37)-N6)-threonylcarbamoyltransferase complex ATPase subunit type 1 TsaE [Bacteroidia bacterium]